MDKVFGTAFYIVFLSASAGLVSEEAKRTFGDPHTSGLTLILDFGIALVTMSLIFLHASIIASGSSYKEVLRQLFKIKKK